MLLQQRAGGYGEEPDHDDCANHHGDQPPALAPVQVAPKDPDSQADQYREDGSALSA